MPADDGRRVALLHLNAEKPVVLEGPAAIIWSLIDGTGSEHQIIEELAAVYGEPVAAISEHTAAFLDSLASQEFIVPVLHGT